MPTANMISGSVVPATRRASRTGRERFGTNFTDLRLIACEHRRSVADAPSVLGSRFGLARVPGAWGRPRLPCELEIALGDGGVNHSTQLAPDRIGARRQHLGHEDRDQLLGRIDPERGGRSPAPSIFAGAAGNE